MDEYNIVPLSLETDQEEVVNLMCNQFLVREPTALGLGATPADQIDLYNPSIIQCLKSGMSLGARYEPSKELVAIMLNKILTPANKSSVASNLETTNKNKVEVILHSMFEEVETAVDIFDKFKVQKVFEFAHLCTHEDHGGKGIGKLLVERSELLAVKNGCQLGNVIVSNLGSQATFSKRGYEMYLKYDFSKNSNIDIDKTEGSKGWLSFAKLL